MNLETPQCFGTAVFGTAEGLQIQGNGILAGGSSILSIFEFRSENGPNEVLHYGGLGQRATFRRPIRANGRSYEMLGHVAACHDAHGRNGYYGSCVLISADQLEPDVVVYEWDSSIEQSFAMFEELSRSLDDGRRFKISRMRDLVKPVASDRDVELQLGARDYDFLNPGDLDPQSPDLVAFFRAKAFTDQIKKSHFLFDQNLKNTRAIDEGNYRNLPERMESRLEGLRRKAEKARYTAPVVPDVRRTSAAHAVAKHNQEASIKDRMRRLENRVDYLDRQLQLLAGEPEGSGYHRGGRRRGSGPDMRQEGQGRGVLWHFSLAGAVLAIILLVGFFALRFLLGA